MDGTPTWLVAVGAGFHGVMIGVTLQWAQLGGDTVFSDAWAKNVFQKLWLLGAAWGFVFYSSEFALELTELAARGYGHFAIPLVVAACLSCLVMTVGLRLHEIVTKEKMRPRDLGRVPMLIGVMGGS